MSGVDLYWMAGSVLTGLGVYGLLANPHLLQKLLGLNLLGSGIFLLFGAIARRGAGAGLGGDPVPQALVITAIVVAFSATAIAIALLMRLHAEEGSASLEDPDPPAEGNEE
ncbi:NADH-quinone oxidoreductase subunit K [Aestuariivirga sp.]|uniref:NADH-quinone oxidoreductase subunit K n=1 Tax=Aestuariivirga sp. TaxID=2650926 RepID=UPI00391AF568